jgi:plasmid maintenance system antidote protein VapI
MRNNTNRVPASNFFDMIEALIKEGLSINDAARRLRISSHSVNSCIKERPHLAPIAKINVKKKQGRLPWES